MCQLKRLNLSLACGIIFSFLQKKIKIKIFLAKLCLKGCGQWLAWHLLTSNSAFLSISLYTLTYALTLIPLSTIRPLDVTYHFYSVFPNCSSCWSKFRTVALIENFKLMRVSLCDWLNTIIFSNLFNCW